MLILIFSIIYLIVCLLISVECFIHAEHKILGAVQHRQVLNIISVFCLLQLLSDGLKFIFLFCLFKNIKAFLGVLSVIAQVFLKFKIHFVFNLCAL